MRLFNGRLTRKTLAFSKLVAMYRASAAWEDLVYNLARPLKTLRLENSIALATTLTCDGSWTLFGLFAWERCATCQHLTGRLSESLGLQKP